MNKPITNARVTRWLLLLQEFDITIVNKLGKETVVVNFLSQWTNNDDDTPVKYSFPIENLFVVSIFSSLYTENSNYLVVGRLPSHLSR